MWIKPGLYSHEPNWEKQKREAEKKAKIEKEEKAHKEFANVISNIFAQIPNKPTQEERV